MEHSDISRRNILRTGALGVGGLGAVSVAAPAAAAPPGLPAEAADLGAVDVFLKIDGIPGESLDARHAGEIEVLSFSWGVARNDNQPKFVKPTLSNLSFLMPISKASPLLMIAAAKGTGIRSAVLTARKAGGQQQEFYKVTMSDCLVTSYQTSGSTQSPSESVSLDYKRIAFEYRPQRADGSFEPPIVVTYP